MKRNNNLFPNLKEGGGKVLILFYLLTFYILAQFAWWAYMLIILNLELSPVANRTIQNRKIWMIVGEGGVFIIILLIGIFITQKTIRKELALVKQQRNFLLSITHELKTPISAIKLCLETLAKHGNLDELKIQSLHSTALENTSRLNELIENVLLATRIESGEEFIHREQTNISDLGKKIIGRIDAGFHSKFEFIVEIEENLSASIDPSSFDSILTNLLENGVKYGDGKPITIRLFKNSKDIILEVEDRGKGIDGNLKELIFQKFIRLENEETRSQKGTGLGLYIVKKLTDLQNGKIQVFENTPSGSIFQVTFKNN